MFPESVARGLSTKTKSGRPRRNAADVREQEATDGESVALGGVEVGWGEQGAAKTTRGRVGWEWHFVSDSGYRDVHLVPGESVLVFPPNRLSSLDAPKPSISHSLEYVRQLCDKYEHLGLDEMVVRELSAVSEGFSPPAGGLVGTGIRFSPDPYRGGALATLRLVRAKRARYLVFFAGGELGNLLYAALFLPAFQSIARIQTLTRASVGSKAIERFPTEILQISVACPSSKETRDVPYLVVRLHSSVNIYTISPYPEKWIPRDRSPVTLEPVQTIRTRHTDDKRIMDFALDPSVHGRVALVDESGGVWVWTPPMRTYRAEGDALDVARIRQGIAGSKDRFHRITFGAKEGTLLVVSDRFCSLIDFANPALPTQILLDLGPVRRFTAIDKTIALRSAQYIALMTTTEMLWMDEGRPGKPILSWKHDLGSEAGALQMRCMPQDDYDCYLIFSPGLSFVAVVSVATSPSLRFIRPPYAFCPMPGTPIADFASMEIEGAASSKRLISLAHDGSLWITPLVANDSADDAPPLQVMLREEWASAEGVTETVPANGVEKRTTMYEPLEARWLWQAVNRPVDDEIGFSAVTFAQYLRELDAPMDYFVTGAELARDSVDLDNSTYRCQALRPLGIDAISAQQLDRVAFRDHLHLLPGLSMSNVGTAYAELNAAFPHLTTFQHSASLAADIALSQVVLSTERIPTQPRSVDETADDVLARAADLSLTDTAAPAITFSLLQPRHTDDPLRDVSLRSLLAEWTPASPFLYHWSPWILPPRDATPSRPIRPLPSPRPGSPRHPGFASAFASQPLPTSSRYAPPVVQPGMRQMTRFASLIGEDRPRQGFGRFSPLRKADREVLTRGDGSSQGEEIAATQVERGPFGGRGEKKKKVKKRVGGF